MQSIRILGSLFTVSEHPQRNHWTIGLTAFGDGLSDEDAAKLTRLLTDQRAFRVFLADTLSISFPSSTTISMPHVDVPIESGINGVDIEFTGELTAPVIDWLWSVLALNVGFTHDFEESFVCVEGSPPADREFQRLTSSSELRNWIREEVPSRRVY